MADVISLLKIKGSDGIVGNDQIGGNRRFIYLEEIDSGEKRVFGETVTSYRLGPARRMGHDNVGWEKSRRLMSAWMSVFRQTPRAGGLVQGKAFGVFLQRSSIPEDIRNHHEALRQHRPDEQVLGWDSSLQYDQKIGQVNFSAMGKLHFRP